MEYESKPYITPSGKSIKPGQYLLYSNAVPTSPTYKPFMYKGKKYVVIEYVGVGKDNKMYFYWLDSKLVRIAYNTLFRGYLPENDDTIYTPDNFVSDYITKGIFNDQKLIFPPQEVFDELLGLPRFNESKLSLTSFFEADD